MLAEITFAPQASRHSHANEELEALTTFTKHLFNIIIILSIESVHHVVAYPTVQHEHRSLRIGVRFLSRWWSALMWGCGVSKLSLLSSRSTPNVGQRQQTQKTQSDVEDGELVERRKPNSE